MIPYPDLIKAALTADALCLGPHWIYDQSSLASAFPGGIDQLTAPLSKYHLEKGAGDFTHYGDNLTVMFRSTVKEGGWDPDTFTEDWRSFWSDTSSYCDGATRATLAHLDDRSLPASTSNDIAGASMALVLAGLIADLEEDALIAAIRHQTAFSHNDAETTDAATFFARAILQLRSGSSLHEALENAAASEYENLDAKEALDQARAALTSGDHQKVAAGFGLSCHTPDAFPLILYYLLRNPTDTVAALDENALAGGDNAARAIIIAIVLTTANGWNETLQRWWQDVKQHEQIETALSA